MHKEPEVQDDEANGESSVGTLEEADQRVTETDCGEIAGVDVGAALPIAGVAEEDERTAAEAVAVEDETGEASNCLRCHICSKTFRFTGAKSHHMEIHWERVACPQCPSNFTQRRSLDRHTRRYHPY